MDPEVPVKTGCSALDELLGGGLERGAITQIYGPPGSGKTNVALSTAVNVASAGGRALYIDTEGLSIDRLEQIANSRNHGSDTDLTDRIIVRAAHDFEEQTAAVRDVETIADDVDAVILDSATGLYRVERLTDDEEDGDALRRLADQLIHLLGMARQHDIAILVTNQVFTDPDTDTIRPLGGHTLAHWSGTVVKMERFRGGRRRLTLEKHRSKQTGDTILVEITQSGIAPVADG